MFKQRDIPIVSGLLVVINGIVFLICTFTGDLLYNMGEMSVWGVLVCKEYGRIVWALFLHAGVNHLSNNMVILFFMGAMIEKEIGHVPFVLSYFLAGLGGNLLSLAHKIVAGETLASIGASGAVFGLDGVLLALVLFSRGKMENVTPRRVFLMIVLSLYNGFTGYNIDNATHVGGLICGFLIGVMICIARRRKERWSFEH